MATTTELIEHNDRQHALMIAFDGIETAFTNDARLVGYDTGADHDVILGLQVDGLSTKIAIDVRAGQFLDCSARVTLLDTDGSGVLAALFGATADDARSLGDMPIGGGTPVHPLSDLTGRPALDEHNIGLERIGANGARHQFAVPPGFDVGLEHSITTPALQLEGAPVSDDPIVWLGRRWALYMVFRDHMTYPDRTVGVTAFRPMSEARIIAFGTMRDQGRPNGSTITLELDGPDSLLRKPLGVGFSPDPVRADGEVALVTSGEARQDGMFVSLVHGVTGGADANFGVSDFATFITGVTADEIRSDVIALIAATAAATGADGVWEEQAGAHVSMTEDGGVDITWQPSALSGDIERGILTVVLSRAVWSRIGYDVEAQRSLWPADNDQRAVQFTPTNGPLVTGGAAPPGPDYWIGTFSSAPDSPDAYQGDSLQMRTYKPLYLGGTCVLLAGLNEGRGQVIRLSDSALGGGASGTSIAHPGQLAWPVASSDTDPASPISITGVGDCDRTGWWLFMGKRRYALTDEVFDERWVGLACWVNGGGQQDGLVAGDTIVVTHWFDPTLFGYVTKGGVDSDWIARSDSTPKEGQIQAVPIVMLGYRSGLDRAHIVLQQMMAGTGTCEGWDSYEQDNPIKVGGDNEPADVPDGRVRDGEIASLGLAIPQDWMHTPADFDDAIATIENTSILDVKQALIAGYQAEDVCRSLMQPAGLSFHLRGGRFGIWNPSHALTLSDVEVVFDRTEARSELHSNAGKDRLEQSQRKWQPIDTWKIATDWQPYERKVRETLERQAPDAAYRYRPGEVTQSILAHAMRKGGNGLAERLLAQSRWAALRHFDVQGYPVDPVRPGLDVWPGTIVRLTDPELWTPDGVQGVTNRIAIVTATHRDWSQDSDGRITMSMTADLLVLGTRTSTPRMEAPIAEGRGYNSATGRLYVQDDTFDVGNGWSDALQFREPTYSGVTALGGNAVVECWQWDGTTISQTFSGTATSVSTTPGDAYLVLASTSGTYYRDMLTWVVLRPSTVANAAWVEALHIPIANEDGEYIDDAAATQDYLPWEA